MNKFKRGFTLIELLIVIAVLSVLITGLVVIIDPLSQIQKANDAKRKTDLAEVQRALEVYYQDNRAYPSATKDYKIKGLVGEPIEWGSSWIPYMGNLPKDPSSPSKNYVYSSNGQTYYLYASLDRGTDSQACNGGKACLSLPSDASCGSGVCNFGLSSPNVSP